MDYEERQTVRNRSANMNVYAPTSLIELLDRIADSEGRRTNEIALRVMRKGLQVERQERERESSLKAVK